MRFLLATLLLAGAASAFKLQSKEEVEKAFGKVNWDTNTKTIYCYQCTEIEISSTGGALTHQPMRLGRFSYAGSLWENMIPLFKAANGQYLTPDPMSNPIIYTLKWVVSETVGGFNAGIQNNYYIDGLQCPWDIPNHWEYEYQREWFEDPTLKITCVQ
eukprot:TRINITY_DN12796_c0_g1_i2.p1 TRINITY_DN12796_c0_g1~~TRINITY_DN12796_c0_g1_i2.p1  ORF type:complete len:158 (-),score=45.64 TRINITY_DN12796_c0_g1_i2:88-561(-)